MPSNSFASAGSSESAKTADRVLLDSHAILVALQKETGWEEVREVLRYGEPWMTLINLGEVAYIVEREHGATTADAVSADLLAEERPDGFPPIRAR